MKIISANDANSIEVAKEYLKTCGIIVFPTETVYGVGALATCEKAVERIYMLKKRDKSKPMLLHVSSKEELAKYATNLNEMVVKLAEKFWPGSLSFILRASNSAPKYAVAADGTIGLRMPNDEFFLCLSEEVGPLIATSANISNQPSPLTIEDATSQLGNPVDLYVDGGRVKKGKASTVMDMTKFPPVVLREGAVRIEEIEKIIGKVMVKN
jgi:L-threonylcarbamoyladenylate synthase